MQSPALGVAGDATLFFKIIRAGAFLPPYFRGLAAAYAGLAAACADKDDPPPLAVVRSAEILFGAGEVCVRMPWVRGREAAPADMGEGGCALPSVAAALIWLARHRLLYVDVREPNVLIEEGNGDGGLPRVTLVDYDDMVVVEPPSTVDDLRELLRTHDAVWAGRADEPGTRPAVVNALAAVWSAAA